jgi:hypothetical protein
MTLEVTNWFTQLIKKQYAANLRSRPHLKVIRYPNDFHFTKLINKTRFKIRKPNPLYKETEWIVNQEVLKPIKELMSRNRVQRTDQLLVTVFKATFR